MVHLVSAWAKVFLQSHPAAEISVTGGGSGTGVAALLNGTTDICAASRELRRQEIDLAAKRGLQLSGTIVARDGVAVIVHPSNRVASLSIEQVRRIYTGAYDNWQQVGGSDRPIVVLSRDNSSGTYVFFQEHVLMKKDFRRDARLLPATAAIVQSVSEDEGAIGYVGLGYAEEAGAAVRVLPIKRSENAPPFAPSKTTVLSEDYSIARPLLLYAVGKPSARVAEFIEFCLSKEGQTLVRKSGYVAVK